MNTKLWTPWPLLPALIALGGLARADAGEQPESAFDCAGQVEPYPIAYGMHTLNAAFELPTDLDVFQFQGTAGDKIRISFLTLNVDLDPCVAIYSPSNQLIAQACGVSNQFNLCSIVLDGTAFLVGDSLPETGTYTVLVTETGVDNAGAYTLQIERIPPRFEVRQLPFNTPTRDTLQRWTDVDYFNFCARSGSLMRLSFLTLNVDIDPRVEIRAPDGSLIDTGACDSNQFNLCSFVRDFSAPADGEYMLIVYDSGVDNPGLYELSINCILGCPPLAHSQQVNGSGTNPLVYESACPPVLGGSWVGEVDTAFRPGATEVVIFNHARTLVAGVPYLRYGELLLDPSSAQVGPPLCVPVEADGFARIAIPIGCNLGLAGLRLTSQALVMGGGRPKFTNALELTLGH